QIANGHRRACHGKRSPQLVRRVASDVTCSERLIHSGGHEIEIQAHGCVEHERVLYGYDAPLTRIAPMADLDLPLLSPERDRVPNRKPDHHQSNDREQKRLVTHPHTPHLRTNSAKKTAASRESTTN